MKRLVSTEIEDTASSVLRVNLMPRGRDESACPFCIIGFTCMPDAANLERAGRLYRVKLQEDLNVELCRELCGQDKGGNCM